MVLSLLLLLLLYKSNVYLPFLSVSHIHATVYLRGYFTRRGKYLLLGVNIPLGLNLMHLKGALDENPKNHLNKVTA